MSKQTTRVPDVEFSQSAVGDEYMTIQHAVPINDTNIKPMEFKCVVRLDPVEEKTVGGIIIPDERRDRGQMAATDATLIAVGGNAFQDWNGEVPKPGDRVMISKYAGITREADPTDLIRIVNDKEILAVLT